MTAVKQRTSVFSKILCMMELYYEYCELRYLLFSSTYQVCGY